MSSSDIAISARGLSKAYTIAHEQEKHATLAEALLHKARNLNSAFRNGKETFWALKDLNFDVRKGEIIAITGRNGAGKSTLLKILSRITEPTTGQIDLYGRVGSLLEVGTGFHPELTGRENIFLNGAILGMTKSEIRRQFDPIVDFSGVEKFLDTPVKRYSSGMYVRLAFAVAAHLNPEILIIDEVLAVGDAEFQKKCLGKMKNVASGGRTVLFVSHNMTAVRNLCTRGVLLDRGEIRFAGAVDEMIGRYVDIGSGDRGTSWVRPSDLPIHSMGFEAIDITLQGEQPRLRLEAEAVLKSIAKGSDVFVAVDICDRTLNPIMQALPTTSPFISGAVGTHRLSLEIELPPLIPGHYIADFWIGPHISTITDYIKGAVSFEVLESPSQDRNSAHCPTHGFVVPISRSRCTTDRPLSPVS